jgi:hypothetical protein
MSDGPGEDGEEWYMILGGKGRRLGVLKVSFMASQVSGCVAQYG